MEEIDEALGEISLNMRFSGISDELIDALTKYAHKYEGVLDLMIQWYNTDSAKIQSSLIDDLSYMRSLCASAERLETPGDYL
jgi:hypothetical protein